MPPKPSTHTPNQPARQQPWRSLAELADSPDFEAWLRREFPRQAAAWDGTPPMSRRQFLKLAAASLALAGLGACSVPPREQIVPYVNKPAPIVPGQPLFFATAMPLGGYGLGLLVESHTGRPTKVEGNPQHPASLGATDVFAQASVLELYDPARSQAPRRQGRIRPWEEFWQELTRRLDAHTARGGAGLHLLTETVTSPTQAALLAQLLERLPNAAWHQYQPINHDNARGGALLAFGQDVDAVSQLEQADVVLSLDADFLTQGPGAVRYAHDFALRRQPENGPMNRLYAVESTTSPTGAMADHRWPLRASEVEAFARALAAAFGAVEAAASTDLPAAIPRPWFEALVRDLEQHRGRSLVIAGIGQPPVVHALANTLNMALGNAGQTVLYVEPVPAQPVTVTASLQELVAAMAAGEVETLLVLGGNPVYAAPADLDFRRHLSGVGLSVHLSLYANETSAATHWHLPETHFLEAWGDVRAFDGTASLIQPLLAPLYDSLTAHELLARLLDDGRSAYELVRATWQRAAAGDFEAFWRTALHDGLIPGTARPPLDVTLSSQAGWGANGSGRVTPDLEVVFRPDPSLYDGRFANNAWLQELPRPITKLTWDNAALISPATARRLGLENEQVVELAYRGWSIHAPVWIMPGHAPDSVTLHLGHGRTLSGAEPVGFNAYALRPSDAPWIGTGLRVTQTGAKYPLATTQHHHLVEGRDLLRVGTLQQYLDNPDFAHDQADSGEPPMTGEPPSLYPEVAYRDERWGMVIDLSACSGCNACVIACQAENNIPVVGKEQVRLGREMHWLRVDSYFFGEPEAPMVRFQPVPCMHCERAPCEPVCPVGATVHSSDGLNEMIYNRCVGTRYCSNNCPYKVRRFNFLDVTDIRDTPVLKMLQNPDVTVRSRGVMEKCTYCVQRIRSSQATARAEGRAVADGEVITACQGACPAQAIVFGDLNDEQSRAAQWRAQPRNYAMLEELNTQPRTTYLAAVRNVNPELE